MPGQLKTNLRLFVKKLKGAPPAKQLELDEVIDVLDDPSIQISEDEKGKQEVVEFIRFLFTDTPELMNDTNKKPYEEFAEENLATIKKRPSGKLK